MSDVPDLSCSLPVGGSWFIIIGFEFVAEGGCSVARSMSWQMGECPGVPLRLTLTAWHLVIMTVALAWHSFMC